MLGSKLKQYLSVCVISTSTKWVILLISQWKLWTGTRGKRDKDKKCWSYLQREGILSHENECSLCGREKREEPRDRWEEAGLRKLDHVICCPNFYNFGRKGTTIKYDIGTSDATQDCVGHTGQMVILTPASPLLKGLEEIAFATALTLT